MKVRKKEKQAESFLSINIFLETNDEFLPSVSIGEFNVDDSTIKDDNDQTKS
jgi:hypothetical protein